MFEVFDKQCDQCLFSKNKIVSDERRKEIIQDCIKNGNYFICHEATIEGKETCCRAFYDNVGDISNTIRFAKRLNIVKFIPHKINNNE